MHMMVMVEMGKKTHSVKDSRSLSLLSKDFEVPRPTWGQPPRLSGGAQLR